MYNNVLALKRLLGGHPVLGWQHLVQSKLGMNDCNRIHSSGAQVEDLGICRFPAEVCGGNSVPGYSPGLVDSCLHVQSGHLSCP